MIPFTTSTSTSLSIEKTANLLQNLVNLKEQNVELPEQISKSMDALLDAQQTLVKDVDSYLQSYKTYKNEDENYVIVKPIVESSPEFLATSTTGIIYPIHNAATIATPSCHNYLKLFIDVGLKHNVGGKDSRGGLASQRGEMVDDVALRQIEHYEIFEMLREMNPPLFYIEDIQKYHLLHYAIQCRSLDRMKYLINLDPSCVNQRDEQNYLPIHFLEDDSFDEIDEGREMLQYLIKSSLSFSPSSETIGGLFTRKPPFEGNFITINCLVNQQEPEVKLLWDCIEKALSNHKEQNDLPCILHQTIKHTPQHCSEIIKRFPTSVHVRDQNNKNRLPIHVALETGMEWSLELEYLIATSHEYLKDVDPVTKCPPFLLAGMGRSCDLRVIYDLLRKHPDHVEMLEDENGCKYVSLEKNRNKRKRM